MPNDVPKVSNVLAKAAREIKNPHAPVLMDDIYVCECGELADDPVTLIVSGECARVRNALTTPEAVTPAASAASAAAAAAAAPPPIVVADAETPPPSAARGLNVRIRGSAPKQVWRGASVGPTWGTVPPHYETVTGFYAEAELDADHAILTARHDTPLAAFAALQQQLALAFASNVIRFEDDGSIVPF